jgi:glycosyltransferase involved in cell wall biosynthesis
MTWQNLHKRYPWPFRAMEEHVLRLANGAIAGSQEAAGVLRRKGFQGLVTVCPQFGVDPDVFRPRCESALRAELDLQDFTVGYVGRLVPEKGVQVLLEAVRQIERPVEVLIVGSGPFQGPLVQQAASLSLQDRVRFLPAVPSTEVPRYLNCLDVLVLPSLTTPRWKEQFGRVLIEAMACGVPVVGSDSGEIPQVVGDAGLIFPEGDAAGLAAALQRLCDAADLRKKFIDKGLERINERYAYEHIVRQTYQFFQQVLAQ